jgi:hypothetical protein
MLKIEDDFGEFADNGKRHVYKTTNAQGNTQARYRVHQKHRDEIGPEKTIYIYAVLQDDNRVDFGNSVIFDNIPIYLVTDVKVVNTFTATIIGNPDTDTSDPDIDLTAPLSADVSIDVQLCNSTSSTSISYQVSITGTAGLISSPTSGATGTADDSCTIETIVVDSTVATAGDSATITFIPTSPAGLGNIIIDITIN